jgi:bifunctional ADP-heptose synthase (sugar kinase/adenylyltransferase)
VIARLLPDILVKGGDWPGDQIVGREEVEAAGGRVVSIPIVTGYSTTAILQRIREGSRPPQRAES